MRLGLVLAGLGLVAAQQSEHTNIQNLDLSPAGAQQQRSASVDTLACGDMVDFSSRCTLDFFIFVEK